MLKNIIPLIYITMVLKSILLHAYEYSHTNEMCGNNPLNQGLFALNADIRSDQMCMPGEQILCNAFIIGFEPNMQFVLEGIPNLFGTMFDCPFYPYMNRIIGINAAKCNIYTNYIMEIDCVNLTTGYVWVAPMGFFEIKCIEEQYARMQYAQMQYAKNLYEQTIKEQIEELQIQ